MKKLFLLLAVAALFTGCQIKEKAVSPVLESDTIEYTMTPVPKMDELHFEIGVSEASETPVPLSIPTAEPSEEPIVVYREPDTIAWISDTQHYANTFPEIYPTITEYLSKHRNEINLAYVVHTGDLVHNNSDSVNWERACDAMDLLGDISFGVLAGNHDMAKDGGGYSNYCKYFGTDRFSTMACYGDSFEDNRGHFDLLTLGNTDYIFVYMSHDPDKKALQFIKESFLKYPDRVGVLCVHDFITTEGTLSETGKRIRENVIADCPNCYLVLCGHRYGLYCLEDSFDDDSDGISERTVYEMMQNYQAAGKEGGSGYFRLVRFNDEKGLIYTKTYSAYLDDYNWLDDPSHNEERYMMDESSEEFILAMPWRR